MSLIVLKRFDETEIIVNENHIVKVMHKRSHWGSDTYEIHLVDGREDSLSNECGKKLWTDYHTKASKKYV